MTTVYFVYGLAFFGAGLLLGFQAQLPPVFLPRRSLTLLAAFALLHGLSEWTLLAEGGGSWLWPLARGALATCSFAVLMQFGLRVLSRLGAVPAWTRRVAPGMFLTWLAVSLGLFSRNQGMSEPTRATMEVIGRYVFGLPGSLLAAVALLFLGRSRQKEDVESVSRGRHLFLSAGIFALYGLFAGVIVPRAPLFPASWLNTDAFLAVTGVRVELARATCAVALAWMLSQAFIVETAREHAEWERRREEFIGLVAHDLRSPIGAIALATDALEGVLQTPKAVDVPAALKILRHVRSGTDGLRRMVADLLDASLIEARHLSVQRRSVELTTFLHGVVERCSGTTGAHPVEIVLQPVPPIEADPARLEQVLVNLLSNAAKYSPPETEIKIDVRKVDVEVEIAVTNRGRGLPPEESAKLFSRYFRSRAHRGRIDGLGLGLYITKGLVEAQGGRIWVESEQRRSTTFRFTLPCGGG